MRRAFLVVLIPLLIISGAAGFSYYYFGPEKVFSAVDNFFSAPDVSKDEKRFFYSGGQYSAELLSQTGESRLVSLEVVLEVANDDAIRMALDLDPIIKDSVLQYIQGLRPIDFIGSKGVTMVKEELLYRIQRALEPLEIKAILIQNISFSG